MTEKPRKIIWKKSQFNNAHKTTMYENILIFSIEFSCQKSPKKRDQKEDNNSWYKKALMVQLIILPQQNNNQKKILKKPIFLKLLILLLQSLEDKEQIRYLKVHNFQFKLIIQITSQCYKQLARIINSNCQALLLRMVRSIQGNEKME